MTQISRRSGYSMKAFSTTAAFCCLALSLHAAYLDVTRIGEGTVQPGVGVHRYSQGQQITLKATPAAGWAVDHWEGDVTGTGATKSTTMTRSKRVTAVFRPLVATPANALARYVGELDPNYRWS